MFEMNISKENIRNHNRLYLYQHLRTDPTVKSTLIHESSHALDLNCIGKFTSSGKLMKISNSPEYRKVIHAPKLN